MSLNALALLLPGTTLQRSAIASAKAAKGAVGPPPRAPSSSTVDFFGDHTHDHHPGNHPYGLGHHGHAGAGSTAPGRTPAKADKKRKRAGEGEAGRDGEERGVGVEGAASRKKGSKVDKVAVTPKVAPAADEISAFRHQVGIAVSGSNVVPPAATFADMAFPSESLRDTILGNIEQLEFSEPTAVQMQAVPCLVGGRDVLACAPTGSGKTLSFMLPMILRLAAAGRAEDGAPPAHIRGLVLSPTRELAAQTVREAKKYAAGTGLAIAMLTKSNVVGAPSAPKGHAASSDDDDDGSDEGDEGHCEEDDESSSESDEEDGDGDGEDGAAAGAGGPLVRHFPLVDILVATPLLLLSVLKKYPGQLPRVESVVLDEADRLLEMGFVDQVDAILAHVINDTVQRCMVSATMPQGIQELANSILRDPVHVSVGRKGAAATNIVQKLLFVGKEEGKLLAMRQMIADGIKAPVLVFVQSKDRAKELYGELAFDGLKVDVMHSDRTKQQREDIVRRLRVGDIWILITTDLMARGMDFKGVKLVVNYDFPQSMVSYVHRIGRTGRAGKAGEAVTLYTEQDMPMLRTLANVMKLSGCDVPDWMLAMKPMARSRRKQLEKIPLKRHRISTVSKFDRQQAARKKAMVRASKQSKQGKRGGKGKAKDAVSAA